MILNCWDAQHGIEFRRKVSNVQRGVTKPCPHTTTSELATCLNIHKSCNKQQSGVTCRHHCVTGINLCLRHCGYGCMHCKKSLFKRPARQLVLELTSMLIILPGAMLSSMSGGNSITTYCTSSSPVEHQECCLDGGCCAGGVWVD